VLTGGRRRVAVVVRNVDEECLRGEVELFEDDDWSSASPELRDRAIQAYKKIRQVLQETGDEAAENAPNPDNPLLSFQLAQVVDDLDFQNVMLRSRSETERLQHFIDVTNPYLARREYKSKMQRIAPLNGFGHKPATL